MSPYPSLPTFSVCLAALLLCGCQHQEPPTIIVAPSPSGEPGPPGATGNPGANAAIIVVTPAASAASA